VHEEPSGGLSAFATRDLEMTATFRESGKPGQRTDRASALCCTWLVIVLVLAFIVSTPPVLAAPEAPDFEEPAPNAVAVFPDEKQLEAMVRDRYPQLVTQRFSGVPVVTALFNFDGTLAAADLEMSATDPGELTAPGLSFSRFGLKARDISYMGVARIELPFTTVVIVYGGRRS
jgi:hypothetical protein